MPVPENVLDTSEKSINLICSNRLNQENVKLVLKDELEGMTVADTKLNL